MIPSIFPAILTIIWIPWQIKDSVSPLFNINILTLPESWKTVKHQNDSNTYHSWGLGTISRNLEKRFDELEIRGRIKTIQTTGLLKLVRILRSVLETRGNSITQTPEKNYQFELIWKTHNEQNNEFFLSQRFV